MNARLPRFWQLAGFILLLFTSQFTLAQRRTKVPYVTNIRVGIDAATKRVRFTYDLPKLLAPDDSLYIQIKPASRRNTLIIPVTVSGDVGTKLTVGLNKMIYWDPLADRQRINEDVSVIFYVQTSALDSNARRGFFSLTKEQVINVGRWGVSAGLAGVTLIKALRLDSDIGAYNAAPRPINSLEKAQADGRQAELTNQKRALYPWIIASAVSVLANVVYPSIGRARQGRKPLPVSWQGGGSSMGLAYTF